MPPKTQYDKNAILEAALAIARERGLSGITARSVAARLGCSVTPIYVHFSTIDDLVAAVVQRVQGWARDLLEEFADVPPFEAIGLASIAFARRYPALFRELVLEPNPRMASYGSIEREVLAVMDRDETMANWTLDRKRRLLFKMRAFHLGISAMIAVGLIPDWLDAGAAEAMVLEVGEELLLSEQHMEGERGV